MKPQTTLVPGVAWPTGPRYLIQRAKPRSLTHAQVAEARALRVAGVSYADLQSKYKTSRKTLAEAIKGVRSYATY